MDDMSFKRIRVKGEEKGQNFPYLEMHTMEISSDGKSLYVIGGRGLMVASQSMDEM